MVKLFDFRFTDEHGSTIDVMRHPSGNVTLGTFGGAHGGVVKLGPDQQRELVLQEGQS